MDIISDIVGSLIEKLCQYVIGYDAAGIEKARETAILKAESKKLQAYNELAQEYFKNKIKEREKLFEFASAALDKAIEIGDREIAQTIVTTLKIIHEKSPFSY